MSVLINALLQRRNEKLPKPEGLRIITSSTNSITLGWNAMPNAKGYIVSLNGVDLGTIVGTFYTFDRLTHNTQYTLGVAAIALSGNQGFKSEITAKTLDVVLPPPDPDPDPEQPEPEQPDPDVPVQLITGIPTPPANFWGFFPNAALNIIRSRYLSSEYQTERSRIEGASANNVGITAFRALMTNSSSLATTVYNTALSQLQGITDYSNYRSFLEGGHQGALAFLFCKNLWSSTQKAAIEAQLWRIFHLPSAAVSWDSRTLIDHHVESPLSARFTAAVACYGYNNRLWDETKNHFFNKTIPDNRQWLKSGFHHQGNYIDERGCHLIYLEMILMAMTDGKRGFYPAEALLNHLLHLYRPDAQLSRWGDVTDDAGVGNFNGLNVLLIACLSQDSIARSLFEDGFYSSGSGLSARPSSFNERANLFGDLCRIVYDFRGLAKKDFRTSKTAHYFEPPSGGMIAARSTWTGTGSNSPLIPYVNWYIGGMQVFNHQHADFLNHYLYYGGSVLQSEEAYTGAWYGNDDHSSYIWQTVAHNSILIYSSNEEVRWYRERQTGALYNSGGQGYKTNNTWTEVVRNGMWGMTLSQYISQDQKVIYLSGDASEAYNYFMDKAAKVTRSFFGYFTGDTNYPFVQFIFDRVWSTASSYQKVHVMHAGAPFSVSGNRYTVNASGSKSRTNTQGRIVGYNMLGGTTRQINGHFASWNGATGQRNFSDTANLYENMRYRLQFEKTGQIKDYFLQNQVCVHPNASLNITAPVTNESNGMRVAESMNELATVFSVEGGFRGTTFSFTLTRPAKRLLITDLAAGSWRIANQNQQVKPGGHCIDLPIVSAGTYTVTRL